MDGGSPQPLRLEVLGPLRAWRGGTPLELGPAKRQAVLAALLLRQGALVSHERLLDAVWGTEPPAGGRKVLPTHVNSLRRALDPAGTQPAESVIRSGKGWYRFVVEGVRLDTAELDVRGDEALRTVASGDLASAADQLSAALALFRGEPLANLPGPFAQEERQRLEERRRTLRLERLKCLVLLARFGEALGGLGGLAAFDRYDEALTALRLRALYGCGRQAEALKAYEDLRVRLRDELGADPGEELRRVHEAVLHQDDAFLLRPPAPSPPRLTKPRESAVPAELPHDAPGFAGRTDELARLHALLPPTQERGLRTLWSSPPSVAPLASARPRWPCTGHIRSATSSRTASSTSTSTASTTTGSPSNPARPLNCCCAAWGSRRRRSPAPRGPGPRVPDPAGRPAHARPAGQRGLS